MKTLLLLRHAKSRRDILGLTDFERPLSERGRTDIPVIVKALQKRDIKPHLIISSSANRAITTARIFAEHIGYAKVEIQIEEVIYEGWTNDMLSLLSKIDDKHNTVMLIGHNPELQNLARKLCGFNEDNLPTSGLVGIQLKEDSWRTIENTQGRQVFYEYPKKYN